MQSLFQRDEPGNNAALAISNRRFMSPSNLDFYQDTESSKRLFTSGVDPLESPLKVGHPNRVDIDDN